MIFGEEKVIYRYTKRLMDLVLSSLLLVITLPVMAVIAVVISVNSSGPVMFKQQRVGHCGRSFLILKFRTMFVSSSGFGFKPESEEDPRVTPIGRFLRRSSLDELPQLINVIKGEMSLVGPRPEQPFLVERYETWQKSRLSVLPGMTGWWQVNGRKQPMHDYVAEDLYYIEHRSILFDFYIIMRTIRALWQNNRVV